MTVGIWIVETVQKFEDRIEGIQEQITNDKRGRAVEQQGKRLKKKRSAETLYYGRNSLWAL